MSVNTRAEECVDEVLEYGKKAVKLLGEVVDEKGDGARAGGGAGRGKREADRWRGEQESREIDSWPKPAKRKQH